MYVSEKSAHYYLSDWGYLEQISSQNTAQEWSEYDMNATCKPCKPLHSCLFWTYLSSKKLIVFIMFLALCLTVFLPREEISQESYFATCSRSLVLLPQISPVGLGVKFRSSWISPPLNMFWAVFRQFSNFSLSCITYHKPIKIMQ